MATAWLWVYRAAYAFLLVLFLIVWSERIGAGRLALLLGGMLMAAVLYRRTR